MFNDLSVQSDHQELVRNAYNAAFHELGLRWYWDSETFQTLVSRSPKPEDQVRHYLESHQPHLLRAYDAEFLIGVIQEKQALHCQRAAGNGAKNCRHFDWAQTLGGELGA
jgi:hypothetical protein